VIAAAVRLGQPATALVVLSASGVAILNTIRDTGPFAGADVHHSLILLQVFIGVLAIAKGACIRPRFGVGFAHIVAPTRVSPPGGALEERRNASHSPHRRHPAFDGRDLAGY
jgi:hypothetical protein